MPLRCLHPWNQDAGRCGIANFAQQWSTALRQAGHTVTDWNANYSECYRRREAQDPAGVYLPADAADYDVILIGWHPGALNHYGADHFPPPRYYSSGGYTRQWVKPILTVYLHDIPPWSRCPYEDRADLLLTSEPHPDRETLVLPYPVIDWVEDLPPPNPVFTVGCTGVRNDGLDQLQRICQDEGYALNASDPARWLSLEDEVRRLARSSVNVCWYDSGRGISGASSTCLASRRPLLLNHSPMFAHLPCAWKVHDLRRGLAEYATLYAGGRLGAETPRMDLPELSWTRAVARLEAAWRQKGLTP